jgi:multiple sugar transport system ATP-binding protein
MNLLNGTARDGHIDVGGAKLPLPPGLAGHLTDGEPVVYGIRPEYLRLATKSETVGTGALTGEVQVVENLGSAQLVTFQSPAGYVQFVVDEDLDLPPGTTTHAVPRPDRVLLYRDGDLLAPAAEGAVKTLG